jgi:hypothetical protein
MLLQAPAFPRALFVGLYVLPQEPHLAYELLLAVMQHATALQSSANPTPKEASFARWVYDAVIDAILFFLLFAVSHELLWLTAGKDARTDFLASLPVFLQQMEDMPGPRSDAPTWRQCVEPASGPPLDYGHLCMCIITALTVAPPSLRNTVSSGKYQGMVDILGGAAWHTKDWHAFALLITFTAELQELLPSVSYLLQPPELHLRDFNAKELLSNDPCSTAVLVKALCANQMRPTNQVRKHCQH